MNATILSTDDAHLAAQPPIDQATAPVDFASPFAGYFPEGAFDDACPAAARHLSTYVDFMYTDDIALDVGTPGALETRFRSATVTSLGDGRMTFDAGPVLVDFVDGDAPVVATPFTAKVFLVPLDGVLRIGGIKFETAASPASRSGAHPVRIRMDATRTGERAVMAFVAGLRRRDLVAGTSFLLDSAVARVDRAIPRGDEMANDTDWLWRGVEDARVEPIARTMRGDASSVEIAGALVCNHTDGSVTRHDVELQVYRESKGDPLRFHRVGLRHPNAVPASEQPSKRAPLDIADAGERQTLEDFLDGIETLATDEIAQHTTIAVDRLLGPWLNLEWAVIAVDAQTLSHDHDLLSVTGTLRFKKRGRVAESRAVLISVAEPADDHACPEIDLLP